MKRKHMGLGGLFLVAAFALSSCGVQSYVERDPSVNINDYKTFAWINEGSSRLTEGKTYQDFQERNLMSIITTELEKNGMRKVSSNPDVLVDYDIMVENAMRERSDPVYSRPHVRYFYNPYTRRISSVYYPSQYLGENNYVVPYKSGTITINIVDTRTNKLIWQGWAETEIGNKRIDPQDMEKAVRAIFKKLDVAKG